MLDFLFVYAGPNANPSIGIVEVIALCMPDRSSKILSIASKELTLTVTLTLTSK